MALPSTSKRNRAFTMIELLSTVGIVAVLASLGIPALGRMLEKSRNAKCVSNLKQWGAVTAAYVADNNGSLPCNEPVIWFSAVWPYVFPESAKSPEVPSTAGVFPEAWKGTIFECPNMKKTDPKTSAYRSYGFNVSSGDATTTTPDKLASILRPSETAMMGDCKGSNALGITTITARHDDFCNVVYMDGHVGAVKVDSTLTANYYNPFWGQTKHASRWP